MGDRATVVAGVGTNSTAHSLELALQAEKAGADGLLLVTPYYNKPGQAGVLHHFRTVAEATGVPVMLYDVPGRTGTQISLETYAEAIKWEPVLAVKDAGLHIAAASSTKNANAFLERIRLDEFVEEEGLSYGFVEPGYTLLGILDANVSGRDFEQGKPHPEIFLTGVANYGATTAKAALQLLGVLDNRNVRGPLVPLDDAEVEALRIGLAASGLL